MIARPDPKPASRLYAAALLIAVFSLCPFAAVAADAPSWQQLSDEDGITVWKRKVQGRSLLDFRGSGIINADIHTVFSVFYESKYKTDLLYRCVDFRRLRTFSHLLS